MTDNEKLSMLINKMTELAVGTTRREMYGNEYNPHEYENNAEDGYHAGVEDGEILLAREILRMINT